MTERTKLRGYLGKQYSQRNKKMKRAVALILLTILLAVPIISRAEYPEKRIELVVPYSKGGATDRIARLLVTSLQDTNRIQIYVRNMPGAGGIRGMGFVRRANPDGYVLGMHTNDLGEIGDSRISNFRPIAMVAKRPLAAFVPKGSRITKLSDLRSRRKGRPLKIGGTTSLATTVAVNLAGLLNTKVEIVPITFRTAREPDFFKTHSLDVWITPLSQSRLKSKTHVPFAVFSGRDIGGISTARSQELDILASLDYAVVAPKEVTDKIVRFLKQKLKIAVENRMYKNRLKRHGTIGEYGDGGTYAKETQESNNDFCVHCKCGISPDCKKKCNKCKK